MCECVCVCVCTWVCDMQAGAAKSDNKVGRWSVCVGVCVCVCVCARGCLTCRLGRPRATTRWADGVCVCVRVGV